MKHLVVLSHKHWIETDTVAEIHDATFLVSILFRPVLGGLNGSGGWWIVCFVPRTGDFLSRSQGLQ
jgi:hypothetical protein